MILIFFSVKIFIYFSREISYLTKQFVLLKNKNKKNIYTLQKNDVINIFKSSMSRRNFFFPITPESLIDILRFTMWNSGTILKDLHFSEL